MYMQDGKPIPIPYGRRAVSATKLDLEEIMLELIDLKDRIEKLEAQDTDAPKRGRKPKEAIE